ncbi:MAG: DUF1269 domain-containing protein [Aestuariivirga sp.]|uniref:DUF1269 domain-containing protein n=1 Tax=Aestuariivirga sp. TaxID=2650926 RepID=UPI0025B92F97|nr:DUF1269 domain-containing protein [Aestuariivirga sp.]MCA3560241.1 DUF1269 domain-containing protein [Aestuariivirga sp.]
MADLIAITYENEEKAETVRKRVLELQNEYLISLEDAVVVVKDADGKIKLNQLLNTTAAGAASGSFWGFLVGLLFMMPLAGVLLGAAAGALGGKLSDYGIRDDFMKGVAEAIKPGNAALFLLVKNMTADKVLADLAPHGGTVLRTSLDETKEKALRDALDEHVKQAPAT